MIAEKWNYKTNVYDKIKLPDRACLFTEDMEKIIACAECGKLLEFGRCFTSREIHNSMGLGFAVCGDCYEKALKKNL